ncbi:MAG TPA: CPBP family intramembrane glutamic endopeptidase [Polyangiaceae bacterium]|nr:CPBP family intramembrane glutamic endopeptidase [Polyangiaceae bacterium]
MNARAVGPAFVAIAVVAVAVTAAFAFAPPSAGKPAFWLLAAGPTVLLAVVAAVWAHREELLREWLTPRWGDFTRGVVSAVLLVAVAWAFTRLVLPVGSPREIWIVTLYGQIGDPRQLQAHAPVVGGVIVVTAVAEELLWRGAVTQMLADRVGTRTAWIWAAVLYALAYVPTWWSLRGGGTGSLDPVLSVGALGAGLLWGAMARAWGRLVPGMIAHVFFDWAVVMMFPLWGPR